jgi:hypothetical protein
MKHAVLQQWDEFCTTLLKRSLNAVLHERKLFDQLDVTLESSMKVKLALTWVATTQRSCRLFRLL